MEFRLAIFEYSFAGGLLFLNSLTLMKTLFLFTYNFPFEGGELYLWAEFNWNYKNKINDKKSY